MKIKWNDLLKRMNVLYNELKSCNKLRSEEEEKMFFSWCRTTLMLIDQYERNELFGYDSKELEEFLFKKYKV